MQWKDSEESTESSDEEAEAYYEEEYSPLGVKKTGAASSAARRGGSFIIWIPVVVILLVLVYFFLPMGQGSREQTQLKALEDRLDQVEKRMLKLEGLGERVVNLEKILKDKGTLEKQLARLEASLARRMDQVDKELIQMRKKVAAGGSKNVSTQPVAPQTKATTYHIVKKGDTLYSIGRRYGLSIDHLRKINKLDKNSVIYTGQKLAVK